MKRNAKDLLIQWGIWTNQNTGLPRYVSPLLALMRDNVPDTHAPAAAITDEDAEEVSRLVARLSRDTAPSKARGGWNGFQISEALHLHYCARMPQHIVAEKLRRNRQQVASMLDSGEWYIQAALDMVDAMAAALEKSRREVY